MGDDDEDQVVREETLLFGTDRRVPCESGDHIGGVARWRISLGESIDGDIEERVCIPCYQHYVREGWVIRASRIYPPVSRVEYRYGSLSESDLGQIAQGALTDARSERGTRKSLVALTRTESGNSLVSVHNN